MEKLKLFRNEPSPVAIISEGLLSNYSDYDQKRVKALTRFMDAENSVYPPHGSFISECERQSLNSLSESAYVLYEFYVEGVHIGDDQLLDREFVAGVLNWDVDKVRQVHKLLEDTGWILVIPTNIQGIICNYFFVGKVTVSKVLEG